MKISLEWVRDYVDLPAHLTSTDLARDLTLKTVEVEDCVDLGATLAHVVAAEITGLAPFGTDGYLLATCDIGTGVPETAVIRAGNLHTEVIPTTQSGHLAQA
jgi:phenylalanyl-tRNA synthetase beta chain